MQKFHRFHNVLFGVSILPALLVMPAMAADPNIDGTAFIFGDVAVTGQSTIDNTAFGGRRMETHAVVQNPDTGIWEIVEPGTQGAQNKYRNEFPTYQMVGRSFSLSDSVAYVGPVNLTLRELTEDDHLAYNWAGDGEHAPAGTDVDLAALAHVDFDNTPEQIYAAVANTIGAGNAAYTAPGVIAFANRDDTKTAGSFSFDAVNAAVDGATLTADSIDVTGGSTLTFVNNDTSALAGATRFYTNPEDVSSNGASTLNAGTLNIDGSRMVVNSDASLTLNATNGATITNGVGDNGGAVYNAGTMTLNNATFGGVDDTDPDNPVSLGNSAVQGGAVWNSGEVTFDGATAFTDNNASAQAGAVWNSGTVTFDGAAAFTGNNASASNGFGGAIRNVGTLTFYDDATFTGNSAKNGGAIWNNGTLQFDEDSVYEFVSNTANSGSGTGGAIHTGSTSDTTITAKTKFERNTAASGGAINNNGELAIVGTENDKVQFIGNSAKSGGAIESSGNSNVSIDYAQFSGNIAGIGNNPEGGTGGAVQLTTASTSGKVNSWTIENSSFSNNQSGMLGGAISLKWANKNYKQGTLTVNNSTFTSNYTRNSETGNSDGGAIGQLDGSEIAIVVNDSTFTENKANNAGGAIVSDASLTVADSTFTGNQMNGTLMGTELNTANEGGGAIFLYDDSVANISGTLFSENHSGTWGGAISTRGVRDTGAVGAGSSLTITGSTFNGNDAAVGGAIANSLNLANITDSSFTGNTATTLGGAIWNKGTMNIAATGANVVFNDNTANGLANDIYNIGTLTLNAAADKAITLAGGIDGENGTLNITGAGLVETAGIKNQTVTQTAGELHLMNADLTGSTIAVNGGTINTIDNLINDYTGKISLATNAIIAGDIDYLNGTADTYSAATGATAVTYKLANALNVSNGAEKEIQVVDGAVTVNADSGFAWFNGDAGMTLVSSGAADGKVKVSGQAGGINAAVDYTDASMQEVVYSLNTASETFDGVDNIIQNAGFTITGNGNDADTSNQLVLASDLVVDGTSTLNLNNIVLAQSTGTEEIQNAEGGNLVVRDSRVAVNINNAGTLDSDPTYYDAQVVNSGTANFSGDIFETGSSLVNNGGSVNLATVEFKTGSAVSGDGTGVINIKAGQTTFDTLVANNDLTMANGATLAVGENGSIDGLTLVADGGMLNVRNNKIDNLGNVTASANVNMMLDANLANGAIDNVSALAGTGALVVNNINLTESAYADSGASVSMTIADGGNVALADDFTVTGGNNYFTSVKATGGDIVFGDKLMNTSGMHAQLGNWSDGHYITASSTYDTATDSYTAQGQTVGAALTALDNAVADKVDTADIYTAVVDDTPVAGGDAKVLSVNAFQSSIQNLMDNVGINWTQEQGFDGGLTIGDDFGVTAAGVATLGATTVSSLTVGGRTTSGIDNVVTADSTNLITSGAVKSAIAAETEARTNAINGLTETVSGHTTAIDTLNGGVNVANSVDNKIATALANSGFQTSGNVTAAIVSQGQNAQYDSTTVQAGTVGAAIKDINDVLGTIDGLIADADATTTSDGVTPYSGNLAVGTTVEDHLLALDAAVGDMRGFAATDGTGNTYATNTDSVAANLVALDGAVQTNANAIATINSSDVMQSGIDATKVEQITTNKADIAANASAIETLNGDATTTGSVANTAKGYVDALANGAVADNTAAIAILNGDASVAGSVDNKIAAIEALSLVDAKNFAVQRDALTLGAANAYTDARVEKLDKNLSAGVAGAVALSSVATSNVRRGEVSVGAGYGYFNGQSAGAFGAAMGLSNRWSVNAGAGVSGYDVSFRAGTNYKFKLF